jgi:exodeoxyribonuclease VII small subunit
MKNANTQPSYAEALAELEQIQVQLEGNQVSIDELASKVARANFLVQYCRGRLRQTEEQLKEILSGKE